MKSKTDDLGIKPETGGGPCDDAYPDGWAYPSAPGGDD